MLKSLSVSILAKGIFIFSLAQPQLGHSENTNVFVAPASNEGELAIKKFQVAPDLKVDLWAAEPMLANPVAFNFDEKGRKQVSVNGIDTFRRVGAAWRLLTPCDKRLTRDLTCLGFKSGFGEVFPGRPQGK